MKAWVRSSGGQSTSLLYAKNFGGPESNYPLNTAITVWTQIAIPNIRVSNNKCEVGFYQWTGNPNTWIEYDDVEFYLSSTDSASARLSTPNVGTKGSGSKVLVYPNPAETGNVLTINATGLFEFDLQITNANGAVVFSRSGNKGESITFKLPQGLARGLYYVRISNQKTKRLNDHSLSNHTGIGLTCFYPQSNGIPYRSRLQKRRLIFITRPNASEST